MSIVKFPGRKQRKQSLTPREIYAQPAPSDEMVWEMCTYIRNKDTICYECPRWETDEDGDVVRRGCRALAEEACRVVFAMQAKEWGK